jgi:Tfp pilus assembly protein PilN
MPRAVAFEWNPEQLRVVLARLGGRNWSVEKIWTFNLPTPPEERDLPETPLSESLAHQIGDLLVGLRLPRCEALVLISRAHVELRQLSFPPAPDEELPDMVRFQASREFTAIGEDWPLDFYPLDNDPSQPRTLLAATVEPRLVRRIQEVCSRVHLRLVRLGIRPFAAAGMFLRRVGAADAGAQLLVGLFSDEADLTLLVGDRIVLSRCARLHADPLQDDMGADDLLGQIRRTIAAGQGLLGAQRVDTVVLCGGGEKVARLAERLRADLRQTVTLFDLADLPAVSPVLATASADQLAASIPLLGSLEEYAAGVQPALDFLHPRRRPAPPSRRPYVLAALGVIGVLLGGMIVYGYSHDLAMREEIRQLQARLKTLEAEDRQMAALESRVNELAQWETESINWLEELYQIATKLPPSQEMMLRQLKCSAATDGGQIEFDGLARSLDAIRQAESNLQDNTRALASKSKSELSNPQHYRYEFRSMMRILRASKKTSPVAASRPSATAPARRSTISREGLR